MDEPDRTARPFTRAVAATRAMFVAAMSAGDATAAAAIYAADARLLAPAAWPLRGRHEIEAFWRAGIDAGITAVALEPTEIRPDRFLGYEIGRYELRLDPAEGEPVVERGTYLLVHALQADGDWRREVETLYPDGTSPPLVRQPR